MWCDKKALLSVDRTCRLDSGQSLEETQLMTFQGSQPCEWITSCQTREDMATVEAARCSRGSLHSQSHLQHEDQLTSQNVLFFRPLHLGMKVFSSILPVAAISSAVIFTLRIGLVPNVPGVRVAIIPIPWNVMWPSSVQMLWSTLSAEYWKIMTSR